MKLPKFPQNIVIRLIAYGLCGLVVVCIPHQLLSAIAQAAVLDVITVSCLQGLSQKLKNSDRLLSNLRALLQKLKELHRNCLLPKLRKQKQRRTDKDKE